MSLIDRIPAQIQQRILGACRRGYEIACENAVKEGSNGCTFGTDVYHFIAYQLQQEALRGGGMELVSSWPKLRILCGDSIMLACHRVGSKKSTNIHRSFPNNANAVKSIVQQQIPGLEITPTRSTETIETAIISHFGNPADGFVRAFLCVPNSIDPVTGRINGWRETHELVPQPVAVAKFPPEEVIPELSIKMKAKPKRKEDKSGDAAN